MFVFAWPPVAVVGTEWAVVDPVSSSQSLITGADYISAAQRRRRVAVLNVQAAHGDSGGYMKALERILRGGVHCVRLHSRPLNYGPGPVPDSLRQSWPLVWRTGGDPLAWRTGSDRRLSWYTGGYDGAIAKAEEILETGSSGFGRARITGLPPSVRIARAGEFVTVYAQVNETRMLLRPVDTNSDGEATIWTDEPFSGGGRINFGTSETGIFRPIQIPRGVQPMWDAWEVSWSFRQVFPDEVRDDLEEIDPWG